MSTLDVATFSVYYGGNWVTSEDEKDAYISEAFYGKKVSYNYPYEDNKERKLLCERDSSFKKMCDGARWVKFVNVYLVDSEGDEEIGAEPCEEELRVERNVANFIDEDDDEQFDYHNTPPNSDDEGR
ncbi:hypothetical protein ISN44_As11g027270 [Arabidopsis suecica]|uniref:Uncharacterized protein n=1 Tax=Arabidopsis suecica TaxID=45249 RepID=A0A8T1ZC16_ARASU|nr:hypothetical protein ISN44_As11g027270 [Arabidopsis suecica]